MTKEVIQVVRDAIEARLDEVIIEMGVRKNFTRETVLEYLQEAQHGGWEGCSLQDLIGIYGILEDMLWYLASREES